MGGRCTCPTRVSHRIPRWTTEGRERTFKKWDALVCGDVKEQVAEADLERGQVGRGDVAREDQAARKQGRLVDRRPWIRLQRRDELVATQSDDLSGYMRGKCAGYAQGNAERKDTSVGRGVEGCPDGGVTELEARGLPCSVMMCAEKSWKERTLNVQCKDDVCANHSTSPFVDASASVPRLQSVYNTYHLSCSRQPRQR